MVHNGIEYGDMQLICEAYDILKRGLGLEEKEIADIFRTWNKGAQLSVGPADRKVSSTRS